jgi:hypothetical protein
MSTATERRKVRNLVFKRSNGQCECVHTEDGKTANLSQCASPIARETCRFVNKENIPGELTSQENAMVICPSCYFKKLYRS